MTSRYETLHVSLQTEQPQHERMAHTIDASRLSQNSNNGENDERVNKFKELYYKNQKLRRQLKLLNTKLNQKLEKLKLPTVKKKAMSVDLNQNPPSKALQREIQNAYKQVTMYKKQVQVLKIKEETPENYEKLRNIENAINFKDYEIGEVQEQLASIKNVKKLQQRVIVTDLQNEDLKQRLDEYQKEFKTGKEKIKDIERKSRKREQQYKKQQAYLIQLDKKIREMHRLEGQEQEPELVVQPVDEVSDMEFNVVKQEIAKEKHQNQEVCKKLDVMRKFVKGLREEKNRTDQKYKERDAESKMLNIKIERYKRLLKDLESKTDHMNSHEHQINNKILKLDEVDLESDNSEHKDNEDQKSLSISQPPSTIQQMKDEMEKGERQWKGKSRKISMGYMNSTDTLFQESGKLIGLKVFLDENKAISGLCCLMLENSNTKQSRLIGNSSSIELKWEAALGQKISMISGSFSEQGYLGEIILQSSNGQSAKFGAMTYSDGFKFKLEKDEYYSGVYGGFRRLGQDVRFTEIGVWMTRQ